MMESKDIKHLILGGLLIAGMVILGAVFAAYYLDIRAMELGYTHETLRGHGWAEWVKK